MGALSAGGLVQALSSFTTLVNTANTAFGAVQNLSGRNDSLRAQQDLALRQLQAQQGLAETNAAERAAAERAALNTQTAQAEEQRRTALKRAVARQRAQFGAQGFGAEDGSGQAVLLGLFDESGQERRQREQMDSLKNSAIQTDLDQQKRLNVLQRTQLQEQQALQRAMRGY